MTGIWKIHVRRHAGTSKQVRRVWILIGKTGQQKAPKMPLEGWRRNLSKLALVSLSFND